MKVLVFGTSYCATAQRLRLLEQWAEALQRIAPDMDHLIVDSQSPVFNTAAHPCLSRFGLPAPCPSVPMPVPVARRSIVGFPDNVGHLAAGGRDGWGRAFSQGLLCATSGGYDYVVHVEGDLLTRLDVSTICRLMQDRRIDALGTPTPGLGWLETGLLFLRVEYVRQSRLVERYDWQRRLALPYPEAVMSELLGGNAFLQLWRGAKDGLVSLPCRIIDLHWVTKAGGPGIYDEFMAGGPWPAWEFGGPAGLEPRAETAAWYRQITGGIANGQHHLALMYATGKAVPQDYAEAVALYRKAAERGYAPSQNNLGLLYYNGEGVPQDVVEAARWFEKAANQGFATSQFMLGDIYDKGAGVPLDHAKAAEWYRKAAEQGFIAAQYNLGFMYSNGQGVPQDHAEAAKWYLDAARQGFAAAQRTMGFLYYIGRGVPQDHVEAAIWWRKAAQQGSVDAQNNLGIMYAAGQGDLPQDHVQAYVWFSLAVFGGNAGAVKNRDLVAAKLTPVEIEKAEGLAAAWQPTAAQRGDMAHAVSQGERAGM